MLDQSSYVRDPTLVLRLPLSLALHDCPYDKYATLDTFITLQKILKPPSNKSVSFEKSSTIITNNSIMSSSDDGSGAQNVD
jgi:hypothetical protein